MNEYDPWKSIVARNNFVKKMQAKSSEQEQELKARADSGEEKKVLAEEFEISRQTLYRILVKPEK